MSSPTSQQQKQQKQQKQGAASAVRPSTTAPAASPAAVNEALAAAEALLGSIKAGGGTPRHMPSPHDPQPVCDENGCVLVVQQDSRDSTEAPFQHMLSGPDWSLGLVNR